VSACWWVYLVRRADGALYAGIALDVARRLAEHRAGRGSKALRGRGPLRLVLRRRVGDRGRALRLEALLKRLSKEQKERLVRAPRAGWRRLLAAIALSGARTRPSPSDRWR
jgi:putative endonuclease